MLDSFLEPGSSLKIGTGLQEGSVFFIVGLHDVPSLKLTASLHLKMDGWKMSFLLGQKAYFQRLWLLVSGRVKQRFMMDGMSIRIQESPENIIEGNQIIPFTILRVVRSFLGVLFLFEDLKDFG